MYSYFTLDAGWQIVPAQTFTKQKVSIPTRSLRESGYMYVWLSYEGESSQWVYFDDFKVTHTRSNMIQYNEYYPYGLQAARSWTRENTKDNDYLYNGGNLLNETSGWYETLLRGYDATLGRFLQIDPAALATGGMSAYHYALNNPVNFNDPLGNRPVRVGSDEDGALWRMPDGNLERVYHPFYNFNMEMFVGVGNDWSDSFRSMEANFALMSRSEFGQFYGVDLNNQSDIFDVARGMASALGPSEMGMVSLNFPGFTPESKNGMFGRYVEEFGVDNDVVFILARFVSFAQQGGLKFSTLWDDYGSDLSHTDKDGNELFPDYCAINLSEALIKSGMSPGGTKCWGNCSSKQSHTIRAQELATWLQDNLSGVKVLTGANFQEYISGKTGIVFFQDYWQREGETGITGDHIDLWNENEMGSYGVMRTWIRNNWPAVGQGMGMSDLSKSTQVLFWEIK